MATRANYAKIGLFVILGLGAAVTLTLAIGARKLHTETVGYYTYFTEAVTGLEVGAPVRARGVAIGQVGEIGFAPDHRTVQVRSDLDVRALEHFGLRPAGLSRTADVSLPKDLRAQLASQGLLGVRFVALDFYDPATNPPPPLSFTPADHYIPAARSLQKDLEESLAKALDGAARIVDTLVQQQFSPKLVMVEEDAANMLNGLDQLVTHVDQAQLPRSAKATLEKIHDTVGRADHVIGRLDGDSGLVASTKRTIGTFGDVGRNVSGATRNLDDTIAEFQAAAAAIRRLADDLERDPDMLLKGHAPRKSP